MLARIERRAAQIEGRGACRHPDGVVRLVRSALTVFADDARAPRAGHPCPRAPAPIGADLPAEPVRADRSAVGDRADARSRLRLRVDPVACDAYGFCAELLPERITLDEWGYPIVDGTPVDADLVGLATRAAAACPRRALLLERRCRHGQRPSEQSPSVGPAGQVTGQLQTVPEAGARRRSDRWSPAAACRRRQSH